MHVDPKYRAAAVPLMYPVPVTAGPILTEYVGEVVAGVSVIVSCTDIP